MQRRFLFLQGIASPFSARLGGWLAGRGEGVYRINFCAGDALFWVGRAAWNYRGGLDRLADYAGEKYDSHQVTDLVVFGDQRPLHQAAIAAARRRGIRLHTLEEGYFRPNYITLERGLANAGSALPRDPTWYLEAAGCLEGRESASPVLKPLRARVLYDVAYHGANALNCMAYRGYRTHRPFNSLVEYAGWGRRYVRYPWWRFADRGIVQRLLADRVAYFLVPLQLNGDYQVRRYSGFPHMRSLIEHVMRSFATHAPRGAALVFKNHPLDTGLCDYAGWIRRLGSELDLSPRAVYLESGYLPALFERARGVVTLNSTAGLSALQHSRPVKVLGQAIYDISGLTSQCCLDEFWRNPTPPDLELYRAYRRVVIHATQVAGDFFTRTGMATAIEGCGRRLVEPSSRLERLLERYPISAGPVRQVG